MMVITVGLIIVGCGDGAVVDTVDRGDSCN